ncbi:ABC transporter ATP-binding protein [Candidatus Woesearchaeota archaeon]|nr:ABC transporter ATP-binding protein [Candidatus Woesearchaeota archaeon]
MKKEKIIELNEVWKIYKMDEVDFPALQGMNLDVNKGECLAVVGPSGSGKSTALNAIGALDIPTKGVIYLDEKDISKLSESELAQIRGKKIGFVFQSFHLIPSLSALENVALPMTFQRTSIAERMKRAKELLILVGLGDKLNNLPSQLSGGQSQRVAIARALANNPEVILADEPTGNLDSKTGVEILNLLKNLNKKEGKTLIVVTHDEKIAKEADRIAYLQDGKVVSVKKK